MLTSGERNTGLQCLGFESTRGPELCEQTQFKVTVELYDNEGAHRLC